MRTPTTGRAGRRLALAGALAALVVVALVAFLLGRESRGRTLDERDTYVATLTDLRAQDRGLAFCTRRSGAGDVCGLAVVDPATPTPRVGSRVRVTRFAVRNGDDAVVLAFLRPAS